MKRKAISILMCTAMAATLFTGCGNTKDEGTSGTKANSGEKSKVDLVMWGQKKIRVC